MRKLCFVLAFALVSTFAFADNSIEKDLETTKIEKAIDTHDYVVKTNVISKSFNHCTITVSIYHDGVLVSSATWTDNNGDCELAAAGARMMAYSLLL